MRLFHSVIKRQLALLSPGWVSVKCITHKKNVKLRGFEVNKLHNVTSSMPGEPKPSQAQNPSFSLFLLGAPAQHFSLNRFTDTRKMENERRKDNLQLSTKSHMHRGDTWSGTG